MQLQHQVVGDRTNAQDHHAHQVQGRHMVGVDRAVAGGPGGEEQLTVLALDDQLYRERPGDCG
jgi:hypothetical protein